MIILLTAFEPFGLVRGALLKKNASKEVLELIQQNSGTHDMRFEVLPVNKDGESKFNQLLHSVKPDGVISLGENLLQSGGNVHIEPHAVNSPAVSLPLPGIRDIIPSEFAGEAIESIGQDQSSKIGEYYCNRIYRAALLWGQGRKPAVFVHVPVCGSRAQHVSQVMKVVTLMRAEIKGKG